MLHIFFITGIHTLQYRSHIARAGKPFSKPLVQDIAILILSSKNKFPAFKYRAAHSLNIRSKFKQSVTVISFVEAKMF